MLGNDSTPGQIGSTPCPACGTRIFFVFAGGPQRLTCLSCERDVSIEVVHNGKKWVSRTVDSSPWP